MMLHGVPVGKMFFAGAPRVRRADVRVLPCMPRDSKSIVVEAYPALLVRHLIGAEPYKSDERFKGIQRSRARKKLVRKLQTDDIHRSYGVIVDLSRGIQQRMAEEHTGDALDAVLCAIQAASGQLSPDCRFGIPADADPVEGWIVDPHCRCEPGNRR